MLVILVTTKLHVRCIEFLVTILNKSVIANLGGWARIYLDSKQIVTFTILLGNRI